MPSITIREKDLTSAGNLEITTNAVYIPGYANMGPVNTPTMCNTLEEFQSIFGSEPYKFTKNEEWPDQDNWESGAIASAMGLFYQPEDYEKSYIMACELLRLGLPVLYERVFTIGNSGFVSNDLAFYPETTYKKSGLGIYSISDSNLTNLLATCLYETDANTFVWSASTATDLIKIVAKDPGRASSQIRVKITGPVNKYYTLAVWREKDTSKGITELPVVETRFTFDPDTARNYSSVTLFTPSMLTLDNSGLVNIYVNSNVTSTSELGASHLSKEIELSLRTSSMIDSAKMYEFEVELMYTNLASEDFFSKLSDNGEYVIKFITSGGYPTHEYKSGAISEVMLEVAATRGNCTALIDHTPNNTRPLTGLASVYNSVESWCKTSRLTPSPFNEDMNTYAAMFTPYGIYRCNTVAKDIMLPASFGYLSAYAMQLQEYNGWLATAGCTRGLVPNLKALCLNVTNAIADEYQPRKSVAINAITNIKPYGLVIWGARTLKDNEKKGDLTATSFLNIRQLTNDVKRTTWVAAKTLTYEQNSDILWTKFKLRIMPLLNLMVSASAISSYEFKRVSTTLKATLKATIRLYAIEPVEDWDITIELADSSTEISG